MVLRYDIAETIWRSLEHRFDDQELFSSELNRLFREKGIGWELKSPQGIVYRGEKAFTALTDKAVRLFEETGRTSAAREIREALGDISRRLVPDRTSAIQHSMAALECASRHLTDEPNKTLGQLTSRLDIPSPLDTAVEKLWGYASQNGRHVREGRPRGASEAELVVGVACALSVFLIQRDMEVQSQQCDPVVPW